MKVLYLDNKLALDHALCLAKEGHNVGYFHEWRWYYARLEDYLIGYGLHENMIKLRDIWQGLGADTDLVFIADVGYGYWGEHIRKNIGVPTFGGSLYGDSLEFSRLFAAEEMDSVGVKHPKYYEAIGVDEMFDVVEKIGYGNCYVKVDMVRGNFETMFARDERTLISAIEKAGFGILEENVRFIISEKIDGVELGVDLWFNGKEFLRPYHFGNEVKGTGCCFGKWVYESVWDDVLDRMAILLRRYDYRGAISFEAIYDGADLYVIDITSRLARPAGTLTWYSTTPRYGEIVYAVAIGEEIEYEPKYKYVVQLDLAFSSTNEWVCLGKLDNNIVVTAYALGVDDKVWVNNRDEVTHLVFYVDGDNSFDKLIKRADYNAWLKANDLGLMYNVTGVRKYLETLQKMKALGIEW